MNDKEWKRLRGFIAWGIFGVVILVGVSIVASLLFYGHRSWGTFYQFSPAYFPFHFGLLGDIFLIFLLFLIARWVFWPWRLGNSHPDNAHSILKERYAKGEITKEQFEQMMLDLKRSD
jgi:putative membrane protein